MFDIQHTRIGEAVMQLEGVPPGHVAKKGIKYFKSAKIEYL